MAKIWAAVWLVLAGAGTVAGGWVWIGEVFWSDVRLAVGNLWAVCEIRPLAAFSGPGVSQVVFCSETLREAVFVPSMGISQADRISGFRLLGDVGQVGAYVGDYQLLAVVVVGVVEIDLQSGCSGRAGQVAVDGV